MLWGDYMKYNSKQINSYVTSGNIDKLISFSEEKHLLQMEMLLKRIFTEADNNSSADFTDAIMVTGPSASGKTTFSNNLARILDSHGYNSTVVSFDDYFLDRDVIQRNQIAKGFDPLKGEDFDYETIETVDVEYFRKQMKEYTSGQSVELPRYDFASGTRAKTGRVIKSTHRDVIILEGIHAFSPGLCDGLGFHNALKVYICPFDEYEVDAPVPPLSQTPVLTSPQIRFMRRAIRDRVKRNAPLSRTLEMWRGVIRGEKAYMEPIVKYTDLFFNSSLTYELAYLAKKMLSILGESTPEEYEKFSRIIDPRLLEAFEGTDRLQIPENSIFNEFYL